LRHGHRRALTGGKTRILYIRHEYHSGKILSEESSPLLSRRFAWKNLWAAASISSGVFVSRAATLREESAFD